MEKILLGKNALITGATSGIGKEIAKNYAKAGANLILCSRDIVKLNKTKIEIEKQLLPKQKILNFEADISDAEEVKKLKEFTLKEFSNCEIIVNSAGVYGPKGLIEKTNPEDWLHAIKTNLYGAMIIFHNFLPVLKKQNYGKIIQLSGGGATKPMPYLSSYASSKSGVVRLIETLAEEVKDYKIYANAVAPGPLNTRMLDEIIKAGPEKVGKDYFNKSIYQKRNNTNSFQNIVDLCIFLASSVSDGISGKLISALWDDWNKWILHLTELQKSDLYTLRRIVGKDRDVSWGDK